ncbi:protein ABHD11 isoform X5 [Heterocephalus glaber]|uniref:sn-1-specific diacylglycerol lipase ABHD11 n=1 Tax=Heterocephalus glaber TaxID=10181 RepID=A0AAX6QRG9_HETGA|nr:protein ABHD11 isoform X5 [Heterocephalus glaber]
MLRWAVHRALRPCRLSSSRMPEALRNSSGGGREDAEPRPLPLSYKLLDGEASLPGIVLLHGLFGSKANFNSIAKALAQRTGRRVLTVDARNHGDSPHSPDMSYEAMAQDLQALLPQLDLAPCVLIGHSMGGKTAMVLSLQRPELVERLIVVDISPMPQSSLPRFSSYVAAMKAMDIPDELPRSSAWKLADEQLSLVVQESYSGPTLFLIGGDSALVQPSHHPEMRRLFPQAQIQTVPNAGHLVHADRPQDFMDTVQGFLT